MGEPDEYFPRGGKKPKVNNFKQNSNFLGAPEKGEKKRKKANKKSDIDDGYLSDEATKYVDESYKNCASGLSYKTAKPGVLILGRVRQVHEMRLGISLPCKMLGTVMACHISEPYNKLLEAYVNDQIDKVSDLASMFHVGQYVATRVLEFNGKQLMLSMMPQHLNDGKKVTDLRKGCILQAAVSSVEDHGYVMDLGVPNARAFLPRKNANPDIKLDVGTVLWCVVRSSDDGVVSLAATPAALQEAVLRKATPALLPATAVDFTVDKALDNGIEGRVLGDCTAYVQRYHAGGKADKPALGKKVRARVLYVMPTRNAPFLTTRNIFGRTRQELVAEQTLPDGHIVEKAQVIKITGRSVHFRLSAQCAGTMSVRRVHVDEERTDEQVLAQSYPLGSVHRVRVLVYNWSDYMYSVSDQPSILEQRYFTMDELSVGQLVTATVSTIAEHQLVLTVGRFTGVVPRSHLTDAGVCIDPKKATTSKLTKKFKVGQEVTARVLAMEAAKQNLILTLKPSLLAPELEVLQSYEQAEVGKAYTGVIKHIRDYVLVSFFARVVAFVPRYYVTKEQLDSLVDVFHIGQIVNCTILKVDADGQKLCGSLITPPFTPKKNRSKAEKRKLESEENDSISCNSRDDVTDEIVKKKKDKKKHVGTAIDESKSNKKKHKKSETTNEEDKTEEKVDQESKKKKDKKSKAKQETKVSKENKTVDSDEDSDNFLTPQDLDLLDLTTDEETSENVDKESKKKKGKKSKTTEEAKISEESDAIETDIHEDSDHVLTPQDLELLDLSNCKSAKQCKKRVLSLLKAMKAKTHRCERIDKKIVSIETAGLNTKNKKFHTMMHMEKLVLDEHIKKLTHTLTITQEKLKDLGIEFKTDYKNKKGEHKTEQISKSVDTEVTIDKKVKKVKNSGDNKVKSKSKEVVVLDNLQPVLEVPSVKDFWSAKAESVSENVQADESSSSDEEDKDQPKKKRKKLTAAEKVAKAREEEERVREMERRAIESEHQPHSSEQFERALLANPNSSQLWIAYMAFYLQATEMDKARAVGRKALNTICFREQQERLNVWLALLNCEHRFGTKESQQKTLEDALQMNEPFQIHSKLLDVLMETGKQQELMSLVDLMIRKYKREISMYALCGAACYKAGMVEKGRQVMQKAIAVLEKKEHVSILVQFAQLERTLGARERSEALFEQVLSVYPQRVDVCSVYVDLLVKDSDVEHIRQVMERLTSQKLPARKVKTLFKKWIEVEMKIGDEAHVEKIQQRAMEYINKAKF